MSNWPTWAFLIVWLVLTPPARAERPGEIELAGPWTVLSAGEASPSTGVGALGTEEVVSLPTAWDRFADSAAGGVVLRSEVRLPARWPRDLAPNGLGVLITPGGWGAVEVLVDGASIGQVGTSERPDASTAPHILTIPGARVTAEGLLRLELRAAPGATLPARWNERWGPVGQPPVLGDLEVLAETARRQAYQRRLETQPRTVLVLFLATLGFFHLHLFGRRKGSREYLWFALAALDFSVVLVAETWLPELLGSRLLALCLRDVAAPLLLVWMLELLGSTLERPASRPLRLYQWSQVLVAASVVVLPTSWLLATELGRWLWGLPAWLVMLALLFHEGLSKELEGRLFQGGALIVIVCGGIEWSLHTFGGTTPFTVSGWAFLAFALTISVALGGRFHRASSELEVLHHQLERMVEDRASELSTANDNLRSEIAERKLAEEAMRMLERAVEQSIDGILVTDLAGSVQFANEAWARMHGSEVFELPGRPLEIFHGGERMEQQVEPCLERVRDEGVFEGELTHQQSDGSEFPCWTSITLLRDVGGESLGFVFIGRDVSERRSAEVQQERLETKVRQAKKLQSLGNLAGGIAHDYNNLLTGVLGNAVFLRRSLEQGSSEWDKVSQIETAAERAADLTRQLLSYAGEDPLLLEIADLGLVLRELEEELRDLAGGDVELHFFGLDGLPTLELDVRQFRRAVHALVRNAVESLDGRPGRLTLRASQIEVERDLFATTYLDEGQPAGPYVRLEVVDTGCGIEPEIQRRVFDPFFSTRASARGLGLAIALGVVRAHGGAIRLDSQPGEGTTFTLYFPQATPSHAMAQNSPPATSEAPSLKGSGKVLVVDDEALMREVSASILEEQGFEVLTAEEGQEAIAIYRRERTSIRLVLLDRTMPRVGGDRVLREIRAMDAEAVVVMMSGFRAREALAGLEQQPPSGFIQKPFRPDELVRQLRPWLDGPVEAGV